MNPRRATLHGLLGIALLLALPAYGGEATGSSELEASVKVLSQMKEALENTNPGKSGCDQAVKAGRILLADGGEGSEHGGGDIRRVDQDAAWFLGETPIRTCIEIAPDFSVSREEVTSTLNRAFKTWTDYIAERRVNAQRDPEMQIHLKHELMSRCDGSEDLKFYFGVNTPQTERIRKLYQNPTSFAHKAQYNLDTGRGKGLIWVAPQGAADRGNNVPDWKAKNHLLGQLLHELGHVAGCEHIDKTIMEVDFAKSLLPNGSKGSLDRIDGINALALPKDSWLKTEGKINFFGREDEDAQVFEKFLGRKPVGPIRAEFTLSEEKDLKFELVFRDRAGAGKIPVTVMKGQKFAASTGFHSNQAVFKAVRKDQVKSEGSSGMVALAQVKDAQGNVHLATIEVNTTGGYGPIHLSFIENGEQKDLYNTFGWDWQTSHPER